MTFPEASSTLSSPHLKFGTCVTFPVSASTADPKR